MAETKTKPTEASARAFIDAVAVPERREDARALCALMERLSGEPPTMWGPSMIGFGSHDYRYESGREGTIFRIGFSPRKTELVLYGLKNYDERADLVARLGKHRAGKGCIYVKRLADIDLGALEALIARALADKEPSALG